MVGQTLIFVHATEDTLADADMEEIRAEFGGLLRLNDLSGYMVYESGHGSRSFTITSINVQRL